MRPLSSLRPRSRVVRARLLAARLLLGVGCLGVGFSRPARAEGAAAPHLSLPGGPGSVSGLGRSFSASLATGTASYGVDIAVPPAAGGHAPHLSFDYDGGSGASELGLGFRLGGVPSIRRRTQDGLPTFTAQDRFEITGLGAPSDLLEMPDGTWRPAIESGAFARATRGQDGARWEVRLKGGRILRFGGNGHEEAENGRVVTYLLAEELDLEGRRITYDWRVDEGFALLERVVWNDFDASSRQTIELAYEDRPDVLESHASGIRRVLSSRLSSLEVRLGDDLVRRYELGYHDAKHSRLETVRVVGADGETTLPALRFGYTESSFAADGQVTTLTGAPTRSPGESDVTLADLNGDSLPDLLVATAGKYRSYVNRDGASFEAGVDWNDGDSPSSSLSHAGSQLADLDGDGALDLVVRSGGDSFRYFPGLDATHFAASRAITPVPAGSFEGTDVRLVDLDGDRRADALRTTAAGLSISYNLGGSSWSKEETLGVLDASTPLRFSDGRTTLADVNGDEIEDLCHLRSGSLLYWLGRGRGQFLPVRHAENVPEFETGEPFRPIDLDGDGWVDLVRVGVKRVSYALAEGAGRFAEVEHVEGVPTKGPDTTVEFADLNGSGTIDVVWIDPTRSSSDSWRSLELFPDGRAGLLRTIDNGLGLVTRIDYEPAAAHAARARANGRPWTTRMNVPLPVVRSIETDTSLGDPMRRVEYSYEDGTYDPVERTFAAFRRGLQRDLGDEFTPTLETESLFDAGLERRVLRGSLLWTETRDEAGTVFERSKSEYVVSTLGRSVDDRDVLHGFVSSRRTTLIEGEDESRQRTLLDEFVEDEFGQVVEERHWGEIDGDDLLMGHDEMLVRRTFATHEADWLLGFVATEEVTDAAGRRVGMTRKRYDGDDFEGLALGSVRRGRLVRQEEWAGPDQDAFELDIATRYDERGLVVETRDAAGAVRRYDWHDDGTTLVRERVLLASGVTLEESATADRRFGNLVSYVGYAGDEHRYEYDALGRVLAAFHPGDDARASVRHTYELEAPLSRVVTETRVGADEETVERSETLYDGSGAQRGQLTRGDDGWVLSGVSLLDARGRPRRSLRPRFVTSDDVAEPPLLDDAPGISSWRDALGREVRTRTQAGLETKTHYAPLEVRAWDAGQTAADSPYERTPTIRRADGQKRTISVVRTLAGRALEAHARYDAAGRLVERTDPEGNVARYEYDGRGHRTLVDDPDLGRREMRYDAAGNLVERRQPDGSRLTYAYDELGRTISEDWDGDGEPEVENHWDRHPDDQDASFLGKLAFVREPSGSTSFRYDARGRVVQTELEIEGSRYTSGSVFDNLDREVLHVFPDASSIRIRRNARGQLSGYGDAIDVFFDGDGVELERHFNTGVKQKFGFDDDRRLDALLVEDAEGATVEDLRYHFDAAGNLAALEDRRDATPSGRSESYRYDNLYRLRSAEGAGERTDWHYSPSGNLVSRTSTLGSQHAPSLGYGRDAGPHALTDLGERRLSYDALGRLVDDGVRRFEWNPADQLTSVENDDGVRIESVFDASGKRRVRRDESPDGPSRTTHFISPWEEVQDGKLVRYVVHGDRRIVRLDEANGVPGAAPALDSNSMTTPKHLGAFGERLDRLAIGLGLLAMCLVALLRRFATRVRRPLAALTVVGCATFGALVGCSHEAPDELEGTVRTLSEADTLLFSDQLGSALVETDGVGKPLARFAALPYGVARVDESNETVQYANTPRDTSIGLDLMGARFYAPDLGVWTAGDPILVLDPEAVATGDFATANPYAYANLSPTTTVDEDGHWGHIAVGAAIGGVFGGAMEAARQYVTEGKVTSWGRVASAAAGGAVSGAISAAVPFSAGIKATSAVNALGGVLGGMTTRMIDSGGKSVGTPTEIIVDAALSAIPLPKGAAKAAPKPKPKAKPPAAIDTPYGPAAQSATHAASEARTAVEQGATLYRGGVLGRSAGPEAQFWSLESPLSPGYASRYGLPGENAVFDFVETALLRPGAAFVAREAPGIKKNVGGAIEVVVDQGNVVLQGFFMP